MANTTPIFTKEGNMVATHVAAANTASDGSGTLVTILTAPSDGTRVDGIRVTNAQSTPAASSAMVVRAFVTDTNGANPRLIGEELLPAATRSASVKGATVTMTFSPALVLKGGQLLQVCQSVYAGPQDQNSFIPFGGNY